MATDSDSLSLYRAVFPWGYADVSQAVDWINEAGEDVAQFGEWLAQWIEDTDTPAGDIDIAALALEYITEQVTGAEELRDNIYANYICSTFDVSEDDAGAILSTVPLEERGSAWRWLVRFTDAVMPDDNGMSDSEAEERVRY